MALMRFITECGDCKCAAYIFVPQARMSEVYQENKQIEVSAHQLCLRDQEEP